ncbi:alpha/beta fold hydrolase [Streptomyces sp. NPDC008121]|uniref:alpha/beta fold hydrolase n=1 Tax=Streptomyces sp. NPDC008121 TaxID=3364809 RepID=UPI0036EE1508
MLLQSGFLNAGDIWDAAEHPESVVAAVSKATRVCIYDRPGALLTGNPLKPGRCDLTDMPRTARDVVQELHALLHSAGVRGPYVLAGHSLGSLFNYAYARTYPAEARGMVSVDGTAPAVKSLLSAKDWKTLLQDPVRTSAPGRESYDVDQSLQQIARLGPLPPVPLTVLVAGKADPLPGDTPPAFRAAYRAAREVWPSAQKKFAEESLSMLPIEHALLPQN